MDILFNIIKEMFNLQRVNLFKILKEFGMIFSYLK